VKTVGIFEAKAKLSEICEEVARSGQGVVVTRRGKPLVRIGPLSAAATSVWEARAAYLTEKGCRQEFEIPERNRELPASPLDE
jgi:prevent-host-death family protein